MKNLLNKNIKYDEKGICTDIFLVWNIEDVLWRAEDIEISLTRKQAGFVLEYMINDHDATIGVNWDVIDFYIFQVLDEEIN